MKLLVLDGNSILNRAFYGIKLLTTKDGTYTNAIYGFLTMFLRIKEETNPDAVAIAFDVKTPTFRHKLYDGYKAKRKGMPNELASQLPILKELLGYLGYKIIECPGFEADDILGTLAKRCDDTKNECVIATGDRDSLQLISDFTSVRIASTKMGKPEASLFTKERIIDEFGIEPKRLIEVKAIQGDSSDNIPGVAGIGPKGALDLVQRFLSIDYIYQNIDTIDIKDGMRKKLIASKDNAFMSRELGEIKTDIPIDVDIENFSNCEKNIDKARNLMAKLEFFSLIDKLLPQDNNDQVDVLESQTSFNLIDDITCDSLLKKLEESKKATFLFDFNKESQSIIFNILGDIYVLSFEREGFNEFLKSLFENGKIEKISHDLKPIFSFLNKNGIKAENLSFDTMLAAYLLNPSASGYDLERLFMEYGIKGFSEEKSLTSKELIIHRVQGLSNLYESLLEKLNENEQLDLLRNIEIPLCRVLANMEDIGFLVDSKGLAEYREILQGEIEVITQKIYDFAGCEFNINSPKQLGEVLFEKLMLPSGKKTKTGYSTNAEVLESLRFEHPIIELILQYRTLSKLKSTYCDGMLKVIADDNRIHSKFNQVETRTGRISSLDPNLQNIPVKTQLGKELRKFFIAKEGYTLVDADYSQIELRVLAHVAKDENMINSFKNEDDIHAITASQVFNMPINMVTPLMRSRAKAVNFGIVYGIGAFSLSKDIGVTRKEASLYIKNYLNHYSGVDRYMKDIVEDAKEKGYVETMFKRRRYLPELTSSNFNLRSFGERVARNMPIQGTAADIIKIAMINVDKRLKDEKLKARLILQVHDELIVESPREEAEVVAKLLKEEMENAVKLDVPLLADASIGESWFEAKK